MSPQVTSNLHEVFDRAHFPTLAIDEIGVSARDIAPLPLFPGSDMKWARLRPPCPPPPKRTRMTARPASGRRARRPRSG
jgi:hypothetical protein